MRTTRRSFLAKSLISAAGVAAGINSQLKGNITVSGFNGSSGFTSINDQESFKISIFSKHLQWLDYTNMAEALADIGFDGADLTVRPGGHVLPENVERDLPEAAEALDKKGKKIYMITTSIESAADPLTKKILKTASSLNIKHYRMGWGHYDNTLTVEQNIADMKHKLTGLALLNEEYSISGEYQNHSGVAREGVYFGGAIWDIASVLKDINSRWLGSQYDIYHATIEGANTWPVAFKLICPFIRSIDIKDFKWIEKGGKIVSETVPLGEGMVDFKKYFSLIKEFKLNVPVSIHYEYPLGGAENGTTSLTIDRKKVISAMRKDLETLKKYLQEAQLPG
jgi:sugar phosphate isomerase/epimerase